MEFNGILGLKNILPDEINILISKFRGVRPKHETLITELNYYIKKYEFWDNNEETTFNKYMFNVLHCCIFIDCGKFGLNFL